MLIDIIFLNFQERNHNVFAAILTVISSTQLIIAIHFVNKALFNYEALLAASVSIKLYL